jgi:uroporphyrinogen-III synthase
MIYLCSPKRFEGATPLPTIQFRLIVDKLDLDNYDTLIFTSKQAIKFTERLNPSWKYKRILTVGRATMELARELGAKDILFPSSYYSQNLADEYLDILRDSKALYIRPKVVSFDSKGYLAKFGIEIDEKIIYETICKEYSNYTLKRNSIIIFTSPSSIRCFFKSFSWDSSYKAVVIGKATLKELPDIIKEVYIAKRPTIGECVIRAKEIERNLEKM